MSVRIIEGSFARPTNRTYQERGTIHDDDTARGLGFRGGTVAASTHLDVFPRVLIAAYGERWFEDGCLSLYFRQATTDEEPVRACLTVDDGSPAVATLLMSDGTVVAEGTASVGTPAQPSALGARDLRHEPGGLRILARVQKGDEIPAAFAHCNSKGQSQRVHDGLIAAPIEWYHGPSPWGRSVVAPSGVMEMFTQVAAGYISEHAGESVGLWGAMELRYHEGPMVCDTEYRIAGSVVAVGQTPKTETLWYDMQATDARHALVATARVLTRFAKASSPLYDEE